MKLLACSVAASLTIVAPAFADDVCETFIKNGLYDFNNYNNSDQETQAARDFLCKSEANSHCGGGGGSINILNIVNAGGSGQNCNNHSDSMCSETARFNDTKRFIEENRQTLNTTALQVLNNCINNQEWFYAWITYSGGDKDFGVDFRNRLSGKNATKPIQVKFLQSKENYSCDDDPEKQSFLPNDTVRFQCHRKTNGRFNIVVNADVDVKGGDSLTVPALIDPSKIKRLDCPRMDGFWYGAENNLTIPIDQYGCAVSGNWTCGADRYGVSGTWDDVVNNFVVVVSKTTTTETCPYVVFVQVNNTDTATAYMSTEYNPVGHCGFGSQQISLLHYTRTSALTGSCHKSSPP